MLDTNICIYIIKNKPRSVKEKFESLKPEELFLSSITVSELLYGAYKSQYVEKNLNALEAFLLKFEIIDYDYAASDAYGQIRAYLEKQGRVIGQMDMQIAGHALSTDMVMVTNNTKEFERVEGLVLENWV
jgi:tRNA(fMet)-specific endonuclease VapC